MVIFFTNWRDPDKDPVIGIMGKTVGIASNIITFTWHDFLTKTWTHNTQVMKWKYWSKSFTRPRILKVSVSPIYFKSQYWSIRLVGMKF